MNNALTIEDKIKAIHESEMYGGFIESGCATAVSNKLCQFAGSSKTVFAAEAPYSKEYMYEKYSPKDRSHRTVSAEMVSAIIECWIPRPFDNNKKCLFSGISGKQLIYDNLNNINLVFASSFQIGDETNKTSTHGWIGIKFILSDQTILFHISIHEAMSRIQYIDKIANIGIELLYASLNGTNKLIAGEIEIPADYCVDIITDSIGNDLSLKILLNSLTNSKEENFISIKSDNNKPKVVRLEELVRDKNQIVIYKGSFNPIHNAHIGIAKLAEKKYTEKPIIMISMNTYGKGLIDTSELQQRIAMWIELGYSVIITKNGYFNNAVYYLRMLFHNKIIFVMGADTMNRFISVFPYDLTYPDRLDKAMEEMWVLDKSDKTKNKSQLMRVSTECWNKRTNVKMFQSTFNNVEFFIVNRPGAVINSKFIKPILEQCTIVDELPEYNYVNSTEIRQHIDDNNHKAIEKLVPDVVYKKLIQK